MKVFDRYHLVRSKLVRGYWKRDDVVLPAGTIGCVYQLPIGTRDNFELEVLYDGTTYRVSVDRDEVIPEEGNASVQEIMAIIPAIKGCIDHTKRNVREAVVTIENVLQKFYYELFNARYLPPDQMKERLEVLRSRDTFHSYEEEEYAKRWNEYAKIRHDVAVGHREYLLRVIENFLRIGVWETQLCWHTMSHTGRISYGPQPEISALALTDDFAEAASKTLEHEKKEAYPYPFRYAAYIIFEQLQEELFRNGYNYRDLAYEEQERIINLQLLRVGYPGAEVREIEKPFWIK